MSQWSFATQELLQRTGWSVTALEVVPLLRRVYVDRTGTVSRIGLTLNLSHARLSDLRIKLIAPSGRAVEIESELERSASNQDIRIPASQLRDLVGESLQGTWSISVRDEALGVAGQFVGWNLKLNSQGAVEDFQRGLNIPDPIERETDNVWFDKTGRYAVARAMQSDSARIWDLSFAEPIRAIAVNENEALIGVDAGARHLVTATQDSINVWDTTTGDRTATLAVGAASPTASLTRDGLHLFVEHRGGVDTRFELWSLEQGAVVAELTVAGVPALVATDPTGRRVAVADYDRAVRVWDFASSELLAQVDLLQQPSSIQLAAGGETLGVIHGRSGVSLWDVGRPQYPLLREFAPGDWQLVFAPSGAKVLTGRAESGYQVYSSADGRLAGPPFGAHGTVVPSTMLAFSEDEKIVFTGNPQGVSRFWKAVEVPPAPDASTVAGEHSLWQPSGDRVVVALPHGRGVVIGDTSGHVHVMPAGATLEDVKAMSEDVSYVGHNADVLMLAVDTTGSQVASVAADNSVRVWNVATGEPLPYTRHIEGDNISSMAFSPDGTRLALLRSANLSILDVASGSLQTEFALGEVHASLAFIADDQVFVGSESGALRQFALGADGNWKMQQPWSGTRAIRQLAASPRGNNLILVDDIGRASQFILAEGRIGEEVLELPGPVEEVAFGHSGSRVYFRTARWTHRVGLSINGLRWIDSVFSPKPLNGARIVFGPPDTPTANRPFLPAARNGFLEIVELPYPGSSSPGLYGSRDELLAEWSRRLGVESGENSAD
jgi:WD40 repeat protein